MINISVCERPDEEIKRELFILDIPVVNILAKDTWGSPITLGGKLGGFSFYRAQVYWVVTGKVPLSIAEEIYHHPYGCREVRAGGSAGMLPPNEVVNWFTDDGRKIVDVKEKDSWDHFVADGKIDSKEIERLVFANPTEFSKVGKPYITAYHVDTLTGMSLLMKTLRMHNLA